ncbi:MAG TPA: alpha/beta hydrolase [Fimbriiglobus sp.]|jgi:pimeloyl-ACP methyl ester carboxylesterase
MRNGLALFGFLLFAVPAVAVDSYPFAVNVTGSGPPVILIPGLACGGAVWDSTVDWLKKDHECHVLTLGGFAGQKPADGPFLETMTKGILDYISDKKLAKPVVIGHSLGASLAVKVAVDGREKIAGLVCVDGFPCIVALFSPDPSPQTLKQMADGERAKMGAMTRDAFLKSMKQQFGGWLKGEKLDTAMKWIEASDPKVVAKSKGELFESDLRPQAQKLACRVLVLAAYNDGYKAFVKSADDFGTALAKQYPKSATIAVHPNCKHFIMWDEPAWFRGKLSPFLSGK